MCILIAARADSGLWIAANRDELLQRPWDRPQLLLLEPPVFGGRDLVGGGSWLAVNLEASFAVGVTNARRGALPGERSRGRLVVDLAAEESLPAAVALLTEIDLRRYGAFNLLLADPAVFWAATNHPEPRIEELRPAVVAVGNDPLDEPSERVVHATRRAGEVLRGLADPAPGLIEVLTDHAGDDPLCRHGEYFGTVCATVLNLEGSGGARYLFAPGPPCTVEAAPVDLPRPRRH